MFSHSLVQSGVDVNCRHPLGWTALHAAVINRQHRYIHDNKSHIQVYMPDIHLFVCLYEDVNAVYAMFKRCICPDIHLFVCLYEDVNAVYAMFKRCICPDIHLFVCLYEDVNAVYAMFKRCICPDIHLLVCLYEDV